MIQVITMSCVLILILIVLNAVLNSICGLESSGESGKVLEGSLTIVILYFVIIGLFGSTLSVEGIPFVDQLDYYKSLSDLFHNNLKVFILECTELISLTFVISYVSNIIPSGFGGTGYSGKIIRSIVVALVGILVNHYFLLIVKQTFVFSWAVTVLQCFITGTSLVLTPAMIIGRILKLDPENNVVSFLVKQLPQTKVGKALSTATTNSLTLIFVIMIFESQCGSLSSILGQTPVLISMVAPLLIMFIGIRIIIKSITK